MLKNFHGALKECYVIADLKMGKTRKNRNIKSRDDPIGLDSAIRELENGMNENFGSPAGGSVVNNIMEQLESVNPEDKICGCNSLANLASKVEVREEALRYKLVRICSPLLLNSDFMVVQAAAGCLHNLSCEEDVIEQLVEQDVLTPLLTFLDKFRSASDVDDKMIKILEDGFGLLWNILEQNQTALEIVNRNNIVDIVLQFTDADRYPESLILTSLSLLATACDNNSSAHGKLSSSIPALAIIIQSEKVGQQVKMTTGILLLNLLQTELIDNDVFDVLFESVTACLEIDSRKLLSNWSSSSCVEEEDEMEVEDEDSSNKDSEVAKCKDVVQGQVSALEIVANLLSQDMDVDDEVEDYSDEDDDDEDLTSIQNKANIHPKLAEIIVSKNIMSSILLRANDLPENVKEILKESKHGRLLLRIFKQLVARCFLTLSNLIDCITVSQLGGCESLYHIWTGLGKTCCGDENQDVEFLEAASSAMRSSTAKLCADAAASRFLNVSPSDLEKIVALYESPESSVRINLVNIIGDLAILASKSPTTFQVLKQIGTWIADNALKDGDLRVLAEALDKLFDAFSEDDSDEIFAQLNLLRILKNLLPQLKSKISQNKKVLGDDLPIINMAKSNLQRFVKYKEKRPLIVNS